MHRYGGPISQTGTVGHTEGHAGISPQLSGISTQREPCLGKSICFIGLILFGVCLRFLRWGLASGGPGVG